MKSPHFEISNPKPTIFLTYLQTTDKPTFIKFDKRVRIFNFFEKLKEVESYEITYGLKKNTVSWNFNLGTDHIHYKSTKSHNDLYEN